MSSQIAQDIFNSIINDDHDEIISNTQTALNDRFKDEMEVQKLKTASKIFALSSVTESVDAKDFVKGGNAKTTDADVEKIIGDIYDDAKLTKQLIKTKAYQQGERDPEGKNIFKKDTADFHIFQLAQQIELARG
jgi:hypothetical protein